MANGECSCWCPYPNKNMKRKNGNWKCVEEFICIKDYKDFNGRSRGEKTKCVKKTELKCMED